VEEHVGQLVATITQSLDALKNGVLAAQQAQDGGQPLVNEQTAAHLHGTVRRGRGWTALPGCERQASCSQRAELHVLRAELVCDGWPPRLGARACGAAAQRDRCV
jgi:hypothetical protein